MFGSVGQPPSNTHKKKERDGAGNAISSNDIITFPEPKQSTGERQRKRAAAAGRRRRRRRREKKIQRAEGGRKVERMKGRRRRRGEKTQRGTSLI